MIYIRDGVRLDTRDPDWWEFVDPADEAEFQAAITAQQTRYLAEHKAEALFCLMAAGKARAQGNAALHARLVDEASAITRRAAGIAEQLRIARKYAAPMSAAAE